MGTINDLGQMCQSVKFHGGEGNAFLGQFRGDYNVVKMVPDELKNELKMFSKIAESTVKGLPLAEEPCQPSLSMLVFYTDAAGASFHCVEERGFSTTLSAGVSHVSEAKISVTFGAGADWSGQRVSLSKWMRRESTSGVNLQLWKPLVYSCLS